MHYTQSTGGSHATTTTTIQPIIVKILLGYNVFQYEVKGNTCAQIYVNDIDYRRVFSMKTRGRAAQSLLVFISDVKIPSALHTDNAGMLTEIEWKRVREVHQIVQTLTEPYSPGRTERNQQLAN